MELAERKNLLEGGDARTRLAGSNKMEILLFSLGTRETFGINVFKVREVGRTPHITKTPNMPRGGSPARNRYWPVRNVRSTANWEMRVCRADGSEANQRPRRRTSISGASGDTGSVAVAWTGRGSLATGRELSRL